MSAKTVSCVTTLDHVDDDDDAFTPYINPKILKGVMVQLPPSVFQGMKTAAFRRMVILVLRLFRTFSAREATQYPKKEMYVYGGYLRRTIVTKAAAGHALAAFERDHGALEDYMHCDEDNNPILWCANMFMDCNMDIDFHFECMQQNNRFIEYLRDFFDLRLLPAPTDDYPSTHTVRSFHVTSRLLDPMDIHLKIDVTTSTDDRPLLPDFTANQLRQTPNGTMYLGDSKYFHYGQAFGPPDHMTPLCDVNQQCKAAVLTRTIVEIENGLTRLLLVPIKWFKTKTALPYVHTLVPQVPQATECEDYEWVYKAAYTVYLRHVFNRLPKTRGFKVVNFERSVQYQDDGKYIFQCCQTDQCIQSENVGPYKGQIVVKCCQCTKKIVVFTDFLNMM